MKAMIPRDLGLQGRQDAAGWRKPTPVTPSRDHSDRAYSEARQRERDVILPDGTTHAGPTPALAARRAHCGAHDGIARRPRYSDADARARGEMTRHRGEAQIERPPRGGPSNMEMC
jgi:hypothetical protein